MCTNTDNNSQKSSICVPKEILDQLDTFRYRNEELEGI